MACKLFVGSLPLECESHTLKDIFADHGAVRASVIFDPAGNSRGFGFVHFEEDDEVEEAMKHHKEVGFKFGDRRDGKDHKLEVRVDKNRAEVKRIHSKGEKAESQDSKKRKNRLSAKKRRGIFAAREGLSEADADVAEASLRKSWGKEAAEAASALTPADDSAGGKGSKRDRSEDEKPGPQNSKQRKAASRAEKWRAKKDAAAEMAE